MYIFLYRTVAICEKKIFSVCMSDHSPATVIKPLILKASQNTYEYPVLRKKSGNNRLPLLLFKDSSVWSSCDVGHEVSMRGGKDVQEELYYERYRAKD